MLSPAPLPSVVLASASSPSLPRRQFAPVTSPPTRCSSWASSPCVVTEVKRSIVIPTQQGKYTHTPHLPFPPAAASAAPPSPPPRFRRARSGCAGPANQRQGATSRHGSCAKGRAVPLFRLLLFLACPIQGAEVTGSCTAV